MKKKRTKIVGKTYLVSECFKYNFAFQHTGVQGGNRERQIEEFRKSLCNAGMSDVPNVKDWFGAFDLLGQFLSTQKRR